MPIAKIDGRILFPRTTLGNGVHIDTKVRIRGERGRTVVAKVERNADEVAVRVADLNGELTNWFKKPHCAPPPPIASKYPWEDFRIAA